MKLPKNIEIEKSALNIIIKNNKKIPEYFSTLNPQDNSASENLIISEAILQLYGEKKVIDVLTIKDKIKTNNKKLKDDYLIKLLKEKYDEKSLVTYLDIIKENSLQRKFIRETTIILNSAYDQKESLKDLLNSAAEKIIDIKNIANIKKEYIIDSSNVFEKRMEGLTYRIQAKKDFPKTGFSNLDSIITYGFAKKKLSLIIGRPRMFKSAFKLNIYNNLGMQGYDVVSMCLEQDFQSEMDRLQALRTGIETKNIGEIRKWQSGDPRTNKIINDAKKIKQTRRFHWFDKKGYSINDIYIELLNKKMAGINIDVVFIDLFDRVKDLRTSQNKADVITTTMGRLSDISEDLNVHFCCIVQLNRQVGWKRPNIDYIKSSGAYEEFADLILMMYRPVYCENKGETDDGTVEVIVGKDRDGEGDKSAFFDVEMEICKFWEDVNP
jgi:replicative DNA helicase